MARVWQPDVGDMDISASRAIPFASLSMDTLTMRHLLALMCLAMPAVCAAQAYKCTVNGQTVFQQTPCVGAGVTVKEEVLRKDLEFKRQREMESAAQIEAIKNTLSRDNELKDAETKRAQREQADRAANAEKIARVKAERAKLCPSGSIEPRIGLTSSQIRECVGYPYPDQVNKSVYSWGTTEQWVYDFPPGSGLIRYMYFRNNVLTSFQR